MNVDCEGCAGCCIDWRPLADADLDHERRGRYQPLDDVYDLVFLTRDRIRAFLDRGLADALTPRLFRAETGVTVGDETLAAVDGRPAFVVGLRKPPKPVGPFGTDPSWLPTCAFLDPTTLQCRIHDDDALYPEDCADYPGHDLRMGEETECERVERVHGGDRLLDAAVPDDLPGLLLGPQALGQKVFVYPDCAPSPSPSLVERAVDGDLAPEERAAFVASAAAASPGTAAVDAERYEAAFERALAADSWVGRAIDDWTAARGDEADPALARRVEDDRGAPPTPGWE